MNYRTLPIVKHIDNQIVADRTIIQPIRDVDTINIISHSRDVDGYMSALCSYWWCNYIRNNISAKYKYIMLDYGFEPSLLDSISNETYENQITIITDFSLPVKSMQLIMERSKLVIWIDHHETAIINNKYEDPQSLIRGCRIIGMGACGLTHLFFEKSLRAYYCNNEPSFLRREEEEEQIFAAALHDVWERTTSLSCYKDINGPFWHIDDPTYRIQNVLFERMKRSQCIEDFISYRIQAALAPMLSVKDIIFNAQSKIKTWQHIKNIASFFVWEDIKILAANQSSLSSQEFIYAFQKHQDTNAIIAYFHTGTNWRYTIYGIDTDVRHIAEKHGGGGHARAAGFRHKTLLFGSQLEQSNG